VDKEEKGAIISSIMWIQYEDINANDDRRRGRITAGNRKRFGGEVTISG
jgi:hypothetical protein